MIAEPKTLALIEQIDDETEGHLSAHVALRLTELRNIIVAGGTLTTAERAEVSELWNRYVRFTQPAQGGDHGNADSEQQQDEAQERTGSGEQRNGETEAAA